MYICKKCGQEMNEEFSEREVYCHERIALSSPQQEFKTSHTPTRIHSMYVHTEINNVCNQHEARVEYWHMYPESFYTCRCCNRKCLTSGEVYNLTTGERIIEL